MQYATSLYAYATAARALKVQKKFVRENFQFSLRRHNQEDGDDNAIEGPLEKGRLAGGHYVWLPRISYALWVPLYFLYSGVVKNIVISLERLAILDVMILRPNTTQYPERW